VALGPAGPIPIRARQTEAFLQGRRFTPDLAAAALETLLGETHFRTSPHRSTAEYRRHLAHTLLEDTLQSAWRRSL
jgi:CO/xanthine dehydrogenase FAD-binding subunit